MSQKFEKNREQQHQIFFPRQSDKAQRDVLQVTSWPAISSLDPAGVTATRAVSTFGTSLRSQLQSLLPGWNGAFAMPRCR